ncbi:hypothetical protein C5F46_16255 [Phaeovulum veldkampii DSM 11550]|uniref:Uncharacterized protein n=1 Tax=Phaeovulum veldkampii DSM 11550 TaxID=1185920 RepID=A0A2T4J3X4_9RHOB|nr:hypothetical protein C5F46_16255 [Phaeovulum veldkampii DSM 11550]
MCSKGDQVFGAGGDQVARVQQCLQDTVALQVHHLVRPSAACAALASARPADRRSAGEDFEMLISLDPAWVIVAQVPSGGATQTRVNALGAVVIVGSP